MYVWDLTVTICTAACTDARGIELPPPHFYLSVYTIIFIIFFPLFNVFMSISNLIATVTTCDGRLLLLE